MNKTIDVATYAVIVAGILVLTRPGSQGPGLVSSIFSGFTHVLQGASGQAIKG